MNVDDIDWNAVIAVLNERFPRELEIAILTVRVNQLQTTEQDDDDA